MVDYVTAVRDCWAAFRGEAPLDHFGPYYRMSLLPAIGRPRRHAHEDLKVDIAAVGEAMVSAAGEVADGIHVHPLHSLPYLHNRLLPTLAKAAAKAGRTVEDVELIVPVTAVPGDTPEERAPILQRARTQIAFYGSTKNYAFQFEDLGFAGTSARLNERMKAGDVPGMAELITDEMLEHFAVVGPWDELADTLIARYGGIASRLVLYTAAEAITRNPASVGRWGEVARAVAAARPRRHDNAEGEERRSRRRGSRSRTPRSASTTTSAATWTTDAFQAGSSPWPAEGSSPTSARTGGRDMEAGLPVETDTIWRIYSMTKPITAVAALILWEQGGFELNDPVRNYVPCFDGVRGVAGRHGGAPGDRAGHRGAPSLAPVHPHERSHLRVHARAPGRRALPPSWVRVGRPTGARPRRGLRATGRPSAALPARARSGATG